MKIHISHSSSYDFKAQLYQPIRKSSLNTEHEFNLPHESSDSPSLKISDLKTMNLIIAEISFPSTGQGIELGWANILNIPIFGIYKKGINYSSSLPMIIKKFYEYENEIDLIERISRILSNANPDLKI